MTAGLTRVGSGGGVSKSPEQDSDQEGKREGEKKQSSSKSCWDRRTRRCPGVGTRSAAPQQAPPASRLAYFPAAASKSSGQTSDTLTQKRRLLLKGSPSPPPFPFAPLHQSNLLRYQSAKHMRQTQGEVDILNILSSGSPVWPRPCSSDFSCVGEGMYLIYLFTSFFRLFTCGLFPPLQRTMSNNKQNAADESACRSSY